MANEAAPTALEVGKKYVFKGYAEENLEPALNAGEVIIVYDATDNPSENGYNVKSLDGERTDTLFPDEVDFYTEEAEAEEKAEAPARSRKGNGKGKKAAEPAPEPEMTADEGAQKEEQEEDPPATAPVKETKKGKAKEPKAETKAVAVSKPKGKDVTYEAVETAIEEQGALEAALELRQRGEETYFTLGGVLAEIFEQGLWKATGHNSFETYVEGTLDMSRRRARDLIEIYTKAKQMRLSEEDLRRIGYTKVRTILQKVPVEKLESDLKKWLKAAEKTNREALTEAIETEYVSAPGEKVTKTTFRFVVMGDQGENVKDVLDEVKAKSPNGPENTSDADAFVMLITEYASLSGTGNVTLEDDLLRLAARYGEDVLRNGLSEWLESHGSVEQAAPAKAAAGGRKRGK